MGQAGAVAAQGHQVRPATHLEQAPADRRDPLADPHRGAVAGRAGPLRALADRLWAVSPWQRDGTWRRILTALQAQADATGVITWDVSVDTTVVRAHQHAAGARKGGTGNAKNRAESTTSRPTMGSGAPGVG
jgi:transposase